MRRFLSRVLRRLRPKSMPWLPATGLGFFDAYRGRRSPTDADLLAELKNTVFTCAGINAAACASYPPRLYVATHPGQPAPKCMVRPLSRLAETSLRNCKSLPPYATEALQISEVIDHPLLTLLRQVNPMHNGFDLWELTCFYQEVIGAAYWLLEKDHLGVPRAIWVLPTQHVTPKREPNSRRLVDFYEYRVGATSTRFSFDDIVHFRYPDPRDPYSAGLSPLRACWEQASLTSDYLAFKRATWENQAMPGVILSPDEAMGEEERDRLEAQWNAKFRRGGMGRALVAESGMKVSILSHSAGDLAALAEYGKTKEDVANAFGVPMAFLTSETNLANLQAAEHQHLAKTIYPRLQRRDQKVNEQLIPLYDPSGRLFVASDDPVPRNPELYWKQQEMDLKYGIVSINEVRAERGLTPVAWGDVPWLPVAWAPTDFPHRPAYAPDSGRTRNPRLEE